MIGLFTIVERIPRKFVPGEGEFLIGDYVQGSWVDPRGVIHRIEGVVGYLEHRNLYHGDEWRNPVVNGRVMRLDLRDYLRRDFFPAIEA